MDVPATRAPVSVPFVLLAVFVLLLVSVVPATASGPDGQTPADAGYLHVSGSHS